MDNILELRNICKDYLLPGGGNLRVLDNINFEIPAEDSGKIISILAQFRSGKSTLLKIISSIEKPDQGVINFSKNEYPNETGRIIYLPENAVSYPWLSVQGNLEMALKLNKNKKKLSLKEIISLVELTGYENYFPHNSSYGFRFRIALGRALGVNPEIILIDDSFRAMDLITRREIYALVKTINSSTGITFILATANITEAVELSERLLLMKKNPGRIFYDLRMQKSSLKDLTYLNNTRDEIQRIFRKEDLPHTLQLTI